MFAINEMLSKYVGGQAEIQNTNEGYMFRGEIKTIAIEENEVRIKFAWFARGEGFPPLPNKWVNNDRLDYAADLQIYNFSDIGDNRLCFESAIVGEMVILYPLGGSRLDPAKVEGLII